MFVVVSRKRLRINLCLVSSTSSKRGPARFYVNNNYKFSSYDCGKSISEHFTRVDSFSLILIS